VGSLTPSEVKSLLQRHGSPVTTFVETGTHLGGTLYPIYHSKLFRRVHSIELSPVFYVQAVRRCSRLPDFQTGIVLHHGDSIHVLRTLAGEIDEPAFFWLDAHWCPERHIATESPCPLLSELELLASRPHADIIVIDDVHCFGRKWGDGPGADWTHIREETILQWFPRERITYLSLGDNKMAIHLCASSETLSRAASEPGA
jgi:hypothetical protein